MKNKFLLLILLPFFGISQNDIKSNTNNDEFFTVFYNVENFFDTINCPITNDDEFLPTSEKKWNSEKYLHKIRQLEKVLLGLSAEENNDFLPDLIGLCEVENEIVVNDLLSNTSLKNNNYNLVHEDSPDGRGIDCALLFSKKFKLIDSDFIEVKLPNSSRPTRDILYAKLAMGNRVYNIFVNHWSSRWGGQEETNFKRVFAANVLRNYIDKNLSDDQAIIIMGDFNDYPNNESLSEILVKNDLVNLMNSKDVIGFGSYNYRGNWNWLDQIIISKNLFNSDLQAIKSGAFQKEYMMYTNKKGEQYPSRTYGGSNWYGGFSDHLPIFLRIAF